MSKIGRYVLESKYDDMQMPKPPVEHHGTRKNVRPYKRQLLSIVTKNSYHIIKVKQGA